MTVGEAKELAQTVIDEFQLDMKPTKFLEWISKRKTCMEDVEEGKVQHIEEADQILNEAFFLMRKK